VNPLKGIEMVDRILELESRLASAQAEADYWFHMYQEKGGNDEPSVKAGPGSSVLAE
jgi:hypothetical protein